MKSEQLSSELSEKYTRFTCTASTHGLLNNSMKIVHDILHSLVSMNVGQISWKNECRQIFETLPNHSLGVSKEYIQSSLWVKLTMSQEFNPNVLAD